MTGNNSTGIIYINENNVYKPEKGIYILFYWPKPIKDLVLLTSSPGEKHEKENQVKGTENEFEVKEL